jgi:hypothetical protein
MDARPEVQQTDAGYRSTHKVQAQKLAQPRKIQHKSVVDPGRLPGNNNGLSSSGVAPGGRRVGSAPIIGLDDDSRSDGGSGAEGIPRPGTLGALPSSASKNDPEPGLWVGSIFLVLRSL